MLVRVAPLDTLVTIMDGVGVAGALLPERDPPTMKVSTAFSLQCGFARHIATPQQVPRDGINRERGSRYLPL